MTSFRQKRYFRIGHGGAGVKFLGLFPEMKVERPHQLSFLEKDPKTSPLRLGDRFENSVFDEKSSPLRLRDRFLTHRFWTVSGANFGKLRIGLSGARVKFLGPILGDTIFGDTIFGDALFDAHFGEFRIGLSTAS